MDHHGPSQYAVNEQLTSTAVTLHGGIFVSLQSGSGCVEKAMRNIKLGKLVTRGQSQADSKEVIHTLIKGSKPGGGGNIQYPFPHWYIRESMSDGAGAPRNVDCHYNGQSANMAM